MARTRTVNVAERPELLLKEGSLQDRFLRSKAKVQIYGGGFGNGKTTAAVIKAIQLADMYPGCTGLIARSTYPKLNDTIRKEFLKMVSPYMDRIIRSGSERRQHMSPEEWDDYLLSLYRATGDEDRKQFEQSIKRDLRLGDSGSSGRPRDNT